MSNRIEALLSQMTLEEKVSLLAGVDLWHTVPIKRLGINFGAPAGCMADDNILWLDVPRHQPGGSATVATFLTPAEPESYYHHSGWIGGSSDRKWVVASGAYQDDFLDGLRQILTVTVTVCLVAAIIGSIFVYLFAAYITF